MEQSPPAFVAAEPAAPGSAELSPPPPEAAALLAFDARLSALPAHLEPLRMLGQGGSSVVYEALHTRLKVRVALKLLTIEGPHAEQAQKRMLREAELYALLDDPRIPRVYDVNELPDGTPYVVMEMVPGASLEELLAERGALPAEHALAVAREVLLALASVHERGVLHRDVKPANVILRWSEQGPSELRLVDFGIAKMHSRGEDEAVTQRGTLIGTPHYMAPERLAGYSADASSDVYAVGVMLYEMLSGVVPFTGPSLPAIMAAVMRTTPLNLRERGVDVSRELCALVMRAMAREREERFASANEMLAALDALTPEPSAGHADSDFELIPRSPVRAWSLAALLSGLLIGGGFMLARPASTPVAPSAPAGAATAFEQAPRAAVEAAEPPPGNTILPISAAPLASRQAPSPLRAYEPPEPQHATPAKAHRSRPRVELPAPEPEDRDDHVDRVDRVDTLDPARILPDNPY